MRSKLIAAIVVVLSATTAVLAQTKISGTLQCKVGEQHALEVGDRPGHSLMVYKAACTSPKPMEIAGTQTKEVIVIGSNEFISTKFREHGYGIFTWANDDKSNASLQGSGIVKDGVVAEEGTWNFTGGTGKLKGIKGKGTFKGKGAADGSVTFEVEGEYELPK